MILSINSTRMYENTDYLLKSFNMRYDSSSGLPHKLCINKFQWFDAKEKVCKQCVSKKNALTKWLNSTTHWFICGKWWAHRDSNPGQTDYEAVELRAFWFCNLKNSKSFFQAKSPMPTETEPLPNSAGVGWLTELRKWQIPNGFQWPNTEPKWIGWQLTRPTEVGGENLQNWKPEILRGSFRPAADTNNLSS